MNDQNAAAPQLPLPPGSRGLPLVGETLKFLSDGLGFVRSRTDKHGLVFRTHILGRNTAVISGPDATALFFEDDVRVHRLGAMPGNVKTLFAGDVLPTLDGEAHRARKALLLQAMGRDALAGYLPVIRDIARKALDAAAARGRAPWLADLQRLAIATIAGSMFGVSDGPELDQLAADYKRVITGLTSLPIPLPGTAYTKAKASLGRILATFMRLVAERRQTPRADGLTRIMQARTPAGEALSDAQVAAELHHVIIAGFIVWCWYLSAVRELGASPALTQMLRAEVDRLSADYRLEDLVGMPVLERGIMEIQRSAPVLPVVIGRAKTDITFGGFRIPAGWMLLWGWNESHTRPEVYERPQAFEPERFAPPRAEHARHRCAFAPQGGGDAAKTHKCLGFELAPLMLRVFMIELVRGYDVTLAPDQDMSHDPAKLPPEPRSGLVVEVRRRA